MNFDKREFVAVFFEGHITFFKPSDEHSYSYFGGPLGLFDESSLGDSHLHRLLTLHFADIPSFEQRYIFHIPLFYGITHDGCTMQYVAKSDHEIQTIDIHPPTATANWPYSNYPLILPYVPLQVSRSLQASYEEFSELFIQEAPAFSSDNLVVLLAPPPPIGVSLWGPDMDMCSNCF